MYNNLDYNKKKTNSDTSSEINSQKINEAKYIELLLIVCSAKWR